ncbi:hypothetical protein VNO78_14058 [Psophocarpus tetragonolobus]|uniref:Phytosulfokine n=1 Tax=Psophocarpus tetragonolobus TaxID=3891 RepID=A0AAN9SYE1_PSOTE
MEDPAVTAGIRILASLILVLQDLSSPVENKTCCPIFLILLGTCQLTPDIRKKLACLLAMRHDMPHDILENYRLLVEANTQLSPPLQSASSNTLFFSLSFKYTNMKISLHLGALLFILFFLLSSSKLCARPLTTEQVCFTNSNLLSSGKDFNSEMEGGESFKQLLGVEDCNSGDEECLKRRMTLEAHLDYIYTQNHKP